MNCAAVNSAPVSYGIRRFEFDHYLLARPGKGETVVGAQEFAHDP